MVEEVELDLDELTQEDKFYLIQQIETIQTSLRYTSSKNPSAENGQKERNTYVFEDFDEDETLVDSSDVYQRAKDPAANAKQLQRYVKSPSPDKQQLALPLKA